MQTVIGAMMVLLFVCMAAAGWLKDRPECQTREGA